jgi:creatinine amidohydrolase
LRLKYFHERRPDMTDRKPWRLAELSLDDIKKNPIEVIVLPVGAIEPHGMHLPYGTDTIEVAEIGDRVCRIAHEKGARVALLPALPYGVNTNQATFPLAMSVYPGTLNAIVTDLTETIERSGIRKFVLLNGHGGNDFGPHMRELFVKRKMFISQINWWQTCDELLKKMFDCEGDHASDLETSLMLELAPGLVDMSKAGRQKVGEWRFAAMREGWAFAPRPWDRYTSDSGAGDPRKGTAEKGRRFLDAVVEKVAGFLVELASAKMDDRFPFK